MKTLTLLEVMGEVGQLARRHVEVHDRTDAVEALRILRDHVNCARSKTGYARREHILQAAAWAIMALQAGEMEAEPSEAPGRFGHADGCTIKRGMTQCVFDCPVRMAAIKSRDPVIATVYRPTFAEPHGSQRLVGVAGVPMSHEYAVDTLGAILDAAAVGGFEPLTFTATPEETDADYVDRMKARADEIVPVPGLGAPRPALAAGQRWRDRFGFEIEMRKLRHPTADCDLAAVDPRGTAVHMRTGEAAPDGWTLVAETETSAYNPGQEGA